MTDGYLISPQTARDLSNIKRKVLGSARPVQGRRGREPQPSIEYEGVLTTVLGAGGWMTPTTANFQSYIIDPSSTADPPAMIADPNIAPFQIVNRDPSFSLATGIYCRIGIRNGEWRILWAGCST